MHKKYACKSSCKNLGFLGFYKKNKNLNSPNDSFVSFIGSMGVDYADATTLTKTLLEVLAVFIPTPTF